MSSALRFVLPLVAVLGVLSWAASRVVDDTNRRWIEKDVRLRAELATNGAREGLVRCWREGDSECIRRVLVGITRDERIVAAALCDPASTLIAMTDEYPIRYGCEAIGARASERGWHGHLERSTAHLSAIPIRDEARALGFLVLIHDMSFAERRGSTVRWFTLFVFALLTLVASVITALAVRSSLRRWLGEMRRLLRGGATSRPEFRPLIADLRERMQQIAVEENAAAGQAWTAARLKSTLRRHLEGEKVIILANREPYIHMRTSDGDVAVVHPASGLVTALEPVMRACSGVWVAHGSGSADRQTADKDGRIWVPPGERSYQIRRVWLTPEEEKGYYYGFANEGLWPLCHIAHARPVFRSGDWQHYRRVNQKFADTAVAEADCDDPIILVQDYHFALAPRMIRERLPRATILTFWHIPWPNSENFGICPFHEELLDGLLGSSIMGFHTQYHCNNFLETIDRFLEARIDRERFSAVQGQRMTLVRPYPISIEWPNHWLNDCPPARDCRAQVVAELGLGKDALLGLGVDRLDYTKGIEERFHAVERLLERFPHLRGRFTFVQLAAPSRTAIPRYHDLNLSVESLAAHINRRFGDDAYRPVILRRGHHEPPEVFRYCRAADVCYVSSLHDGMNLVAKEFVAARDDDGGALVLSRFTGAARELSEALIVNPYDLDEASDALAAALAMPPEEQADRMRSMRSLVGHFNVYRWAGRMLMDAAQLRRRDRLSGRLGLRLAPLGRAVE